MKKRSQQINEKDRKGERGAALITVLMISFFLLAAITALLFEASMNTANVTDATAEQQAYYAAESGIQSVINVLRHNTPPSPPIDPSASPLPPDPNAPSVNKIDYFKAVKLCTSNTTCNCGTNICTNALDSTARLSRWLNYDPTFPDRVILGDAATYTNWSGMAFSVTVRDPDNTAGIISYSTNYRIDTPDDPANPLSKTWGNMSGNGVRLRYVPKAATVLDVSSGAADTDLGQFVLETAGSGAAIPSKVRFTILVNITQPYYTVRAIRGYIDPGTVTPVSIGTVRIFYDSMVFEALGSLITLRSPTGVACTSSNNPANWTLDPWGSGCLREDIWLPPPDGYYRSGFSVTPFPSSANAGVTTVKANLTAPLPIRLLISSVGYGPQGARKQLETIIQRNYFNGLGAPAPLTLIGPNSTITPATNFFFSPGSSAATKYSGKDTLLKAFLPPVGVTDDTNLGIVWAAMQPNAGSPPFNGRVEGKVENVRDELPFWLQSPSNLNTTLGLLRQSAVASGKYYAPGVTPPSNPSGSNNYGNYDNATGITYIDGDLTFSGDGGGILIVTGQLKFQGGFRWKGLIVITGAGGMLRTGGGSGILQGNMIVAPYNAAGLYPSCIANNVTCFLAPRYDISGAGSSDIAYNSSNVANGLSALTNFVKGTAEK